jgi:hypothetical protein
MSLYSIRIYLEPNPRGVFTVTSPDVPALADRPQTVELLVAA